MLPHCYLELLPTYVQQRHKATTLGLEIGNTIGTLEMSLGYLFTRTFCAITPDHYLSSARAQRKWDKHCVIQFNP